MFWSDTIFTWIKQKWYEIRKYDRPLAKAPPFLMHDIRMNARSTVELIDEWMLAWTKYKFSYSRMQNCRSKAHPWMLLSLWYWIMTSVDRCMIFGTSFLMQFVSSNVHSKKRWTIRKTFGESRLHQFLVTSRKCLCLNTRSEFYHKPRFLLKCI